MCTAGWNGENSKSQENEVGGGGAGNSRGGLLQGLQKQKADSKESPKRITQEGMRAKGRCRHRQHRIISFHVGEGGEG